MTTTTPQPHAAVYQRLEQVPLGEERTYTVTCPCGFFCSDYHSLTGAVRCAGRHDQLPPSGSPA